MFEQFFKSVNMDPHPTVPLCFCFAILLTLGAGRIEKDPVVITDLTATFPVGTVAILKCGYERSVYAVYWSQEKSNGVRSLIHFDAVYGRGRGGPEYLSGRFNITDDFSLIIKDVQIQDESRYYCEVSDLKLGILTRNYTDLKVEVSPQSPFPRFIECQGEEMNRRGQTDCVLDTSAPVRLTCQVQKFYPDIDLSIVHNILMVDDYVEILVNNSDGTKNKSITISAMPSKFPYTCVASKIPGLEEERTAEIRIETLNDESLTTVAASSTSLISTAYSQSTWKIVVGLIFGIILIICPVVFFLKWTKSRQKENAKNCEEEELLPGGLPECLTYLELWNLANSELTITNLYSDLCKWKSENTEELKRHISHLDEEYGCSNVSQRIKEFRENISATIDGYNIEHILWRIHDARKIEKFIQRLCSNDFTSSNGIAETIQSALRKIQNWREQDAFEINPGVSIALALESAECKPVDRQFFLDYFFLSFPPNERTRSDLQQQRIDVARLSDHLAGRHCRKLAKVLQIKNEEEIRTIISDNNKTLFDTQQLLADWITSQDCSDYEMRCKLAVAAFKVGRYDLLGYLASIDMEMEDITDQDDHKLLALIKRLSESCGIFDDDFRQIIKYLTPQKKDELLLKLDVNTSHVESDESLLQELISWRNAKLQPTSGEELKKKLDLALESIGWSAGDPSHQNPPVVPTQPFESDNDESNKRAETRSPVSLHGQRLCWDVHCVSIAFHMLASDVSMFATALGQEWTSLDRLVRRDKRNLQKGTLSLLLKMKKQNGDFIGQLRNMHYMDIANMMTLDLEISLSEVLNITSHLEDEVMKSFGGHLGLTDAEIEACRKDSEEIEKLMMIKKWKGKIHPPEYNFALEICKSLQAIGGLDLFADGNMKPNKDVLDDICNRLTAEEKNTVWEHLGPIYKGTGSGDLWTMINKWVLESKRFSLAKKLAERGAFVRRERCDILFAEGIYELAHELMLLDR